MDFLSSMVRTAARITQRGTAMRDAKDKLIGTWKIVSAVMEDVETKEQKLVWGKHPNGYIILTPSGRWTWFKPQRGARSRKRTRIERPHSARCSPIPGGTISRGTRSSSRSI